MGFIYPSALQNPAQYLIPKSNAGTWSLFTTSDPVVSGSFVGKQCKFKEAWRLASTSRQPHWAWLIIHSPQPPVWGTVALGAPSTWICQVTRKMSCCWSMQFVESMDTGPGTRLQVLTASFRVGAEDPRIME